MTYRRQPSFVRAEGLVAFLAYALGYVSGVISVLVAFAKGWF